MKFITLKHIKDDDKAIDFDYRKMLTLIMEAPIGGQGGVTVGEMRRRIKIVDKLEKASENPAGAATLALEDAEWETVNACVQAWPWPKLHTVYLAFCADIEAAPAQKAEKTAKLKVAEAAAGE